MKTLNMLGVAIAGALIATMNLRAGDTSTANPFFATLSTVSPAELPAKAADLVSQADSKNRATTTVDVVKAAVGLNPAAAPAIVGTIAGSTPEMASVAAATAVAILPQQAIAIARAAAAAAPAQAGKIVEAVCRVVPSDYQEVANAVAGVAPGEAKAILAGVTAAIPVLQEPIGKVLAASTSGSPSVSDVLGQVSSSANPVAVSTPMTVTPALSFGPGSAPLPPSPVNYSAGSGSQVPAGGHGGSPPPP